MSVRNSGMGERYPDTTSLTPPADNQLGWSTSIGKLAQLVERDR